MQPLARALLAGTPVFVLADSRVSPQSLAAWMLERGQAAFRLHALEDLYRTPDGEIRAARQRCLTVSDFAVLKEEQAKLSGQRVFYLEPAREGATKAARPWPFGLSDNAVARENDLLTKGPVRAAALAALGIEADHIVWDLGAGSGAVSLEAARLAWRGRVFAVERNPDRASLIRENRRLYGAANLEIIEGDMPGCLRRFSGDGSPEETCIREVARQADGPPGGSAGASSGASAGGPADASAGGAERRESAGHIALPEPHRVFLGGGLGGDSETAGEILTLAWRALPPGGRLLADCILFSSLTRCRAALQDLGAKTEVICLQASVSVPLAGDVRLRGLNPVFLIMGEKVRAD
jgi:precorrin-6Y C5,15-methyltransferase (decarboxylating)